MKTNNHLTVVIILSVFLLFFGPLTVVAQQTGSDQTSAEEEAADLDNIVVVGTHIKGAILADTLPITIMDRDTIEDTAVNTFEELLGSLPQAGALEFNSERELSNDVRGDVASLNLRTLGADTSLVLLNDRRIVAHPQTQTFNGVPIQFINLNAIPISGLGRIEVLRDGASAIYGSDAVAGVLNAVMDTNYDGLNTSFRYGTSEGNDLDEITARVFGGFDLNGAKSHFTYSVGAFDRTGIETSELDYSAFSDYRNRFAEDDPFFGSTSFRNLSSFTQWGEFEAGRANPGASDGHSGTRVRLLDGTSLTSGGGRFHMQPAILPGGIMLGPDLFLDDGSSTSSSNALPGFVEPLRYNINEQRKITPDTQRFNLAFSFEHLLDNGMEFFSDFVFFDSDSSKFFGPPVLSTSNNFVIPANYYWNPFGPTTLADGSVNPNRIADIDAPAEGLDILVRRFRFFELGPRTIDVDINQWRLLGGLRGSWGFWDWESAIGHSQSEAEDIGLLVSRTRLFNELSRTDPGAFNIFNGNELSTLAADNFGVLVTRKSENSLTTGDFRISNSDVAEMPAGPVGVAFGVEWRREEIDDDRDSRLDGTVTFTNPLTEQFFDSDLLGVSATPDINADRDVYSVYGEVILPLTSTLSAQVAARLEDYSDFGSSGVKPRVSLSWRPTDVFQIRGSWSEGFRAPNLEQIFQPEFSRFTNFQTDYSQCTFMDRCDDDAVVARISGNQNLDPEDSESYTLGITLQPAFASGLTVTVDYWEVELEGTVGLVGRNNHIALDEYMRRTAGMANPAVVRAAPTAEETALIDAYNAANGTSIAAFGEILFVQDQFLNLQKRTVSGIDTNLVYDFEIGDAGDFSVILNAAYLDKYEQDVSPQLAPLLDDAIASGNLDPETVGDLVEVEARPEWRYNIQTRWRRGAWGAGLSAKYVGEVFDPDVRATLDDGTVINYKVDDWLTFNTYVDYRFQSQGFWDNSKIRFGIRNLTDEDPPLFDNSAGYTSQLHSNRGRYWYIDLRKRF